MRGRAAQAVVVATIALHALAAFAAPDAHRVVAVPIAEGVVIEMVEATNGFFIGKYEVTQKQWKTLMKTEPFNIFGDRRPAERVPWHDAQEFIRRANALESVQSAGLRFRLPTEAEWELCCRAGSTNELGVLQSGKVPPLRDIAWYQANSLQTTHDVGTRKPNAWGIHDMFGNVLEMCDTFVFGGCIIKGGGWVSPEQSCRASYRYPMFTYMYHDDLGFRLAADMRMENGNWEKGNRERGKEKGESSKGKGGGKGE